MTFLQTLPRRPGRAIVVVAGALWAMLLFRAADTPGQQPVDVLRIGTTTLAGKDPAREKGALESLRGYIKDETGLDNAILRQKDWRELADQMAKGRLQVGVFQGYEFAWAREKYPDLKPLAAAVNVYTYPVGNVLVRQKDAPKDFAGLAGRSLSLPREGPPFLRLYLEEQCRARGKSLEAFFSKVTTPDDVEDAVDDVVDGVVQVTAVDRAALEAYKRRKPARFNKLTVVAHSQPFPPPVVAYYGNALDRATRQKLLDGLLGASRKERGRTMLNLFRLTAVVAVPEDLDQVLERFRKDYPPPAAKPKE